jgi:hypothetical protein
MPPSIQKRNKEKLRQDRQRLKESKRQERKAAARENENQPAAEPGYDPDIAGIIPGPQPIQEEP